MDKTILTARSVAPTPAPMPPQTRAALLVEYLSARAAGDFDRALEIGIGAFEHDQAHPDEPRLMDELRGLSAEAVAA